MTPFLKSALHNAARGWYVFPLVPNDKKPRISKTDGGQGFHDATLDTAQITEWWTKWPNCNVGIAPGASGMCVLDVDTGLTNLESFESWRERNGLPKTFSVRTGRRPEFRVQMYFLGTREDCDGWELNGCQGDIRSMGGYVCAIGSVHPSGYLYEPLYSGDEVPLAPMPDVVAQLKTKAHPVVPGEPFKKLRTGDGRHADATSEAGRLRNKGLEPDQIAAALIPFSDARHEPPLPFADLEHIARSIGAKPLPPPEPKLIIGKAAPVEADTSLDAEILERGKRPVYPDAVWSGTFYGEFADLCSADNYVPKKFFSEALRTAVGAIMGAQVTTTVTGGNPRMYTILIGPPGSGKGTACEYLMQLFDERWDGLKRTEAPLLYYADCPWNARGIGARIVNPASAPGLMMALIGKKTSKGEDADPLKVWAPLPRMITLMEEVRGLFANFTNEASGAGLEGALCELYDRTSFSSTATKQRQPEAADVMYSLLGGITKELWDSIFSKAESAESGFLSRVNIVATENDRRVGGLQQPNFAALRNRLFPALMDLEKNPRHIKPSPGALGLMGEWFGALTMPEGVTTARLNIHAWRTALHLAWLRGGEFITEPDVEAGIRVAEYQKEMRIWHAPAQGDTRAARCEAAMRKVLREVRRITIRDLKRLTSYNRVGSVVWARCAQALADAKEIRLVADKTNPRKVWAILLKMQD